ncbi:MAG TPA: peptide-methionine (S)-S-oxide reductase MsrA [Xanthobacteraceae bacterium]|nr:peptide-methionine (S)-S-oxide reductase MsrA [Xanthobacteraceae bacterium]
MKWLVALTLGMVVQIAACAAEPAVPIPAPALDNEKSAGPLQTAVLAGGCFWGTQGVFEHLRGVRRVVSGYAGGEKDTAQYETVSTGRTGHAESVQITFDPQQVSYGEILQVFFSVAHDPTQLNRQGPDVGTQYRSAIFFADDTQRKIAAAYIAQLQQSGAFRRPIVTRLEPLRGFYPAEGYHQDFLLRNPSDPYIVFNDLPKIRNFEKTLPALYVPTPVTVQ